MATRIVFEAFYESEVAEDATSAGRKLFIVAPSWVRAAGKAFTSIGDGETLVSLMIAKDAKVV